MNENTSTPMLKASPAADQDHDLDTNFSRQLELLARRTGALEPGISWVRRAAFAVSRATSEGHVCVPLATLAQRHGASVDEIRAALRETALVTDLRDGTAICDDISAHTLRPLVIDAQDRLYLARYYDYERRLAHALAAHAKPLPTDDRHAPVDVDVLRARLSRFFGAPQHEGVDWQRIAAILALSGRLTIISGGPGTGKTTTVALILACLLDAQSVSSAASAPQAQTSPPPSSLRIALAAPTGKAAQRMQQALHARAAHLPPALAAQLPQTSYTLHRLLGQGANGQFRYRRDNPLPYNMVVIDEASMIDVALAAHLFDALAPSTRLVLLGDKDQLAAVEAGAVFAELSAHPSFSRAMLTRVADVLAPDAGVSVDALQRALPQTTMPSPDTDTLTDCVAWLDRNYRFGSTSAIGQLATAIRRGAAQEALAALTHDAHAAALHEDAGVTLSATTLAQLEAGFVPYAKALTQTLANPAHDLTALFDALNHFRVLCATRTGTRGVAWLNAQLGAHIRQITQPALTKDTPWFAGRPVIITRNDYALGLFNGDTGIVLPADNGALRVWFYSSEGHARAIAPASLPPHDTAFALTVHKSQGSEFDRVALVLPAHPHVVLTRELVYTAITRAKTSVDIYGTHDVLAHAIAIPTQRDSGLAARIAEALHGHGHHSSHSSASSTPQPSHQA